MEDMKEIWWKEAIIYQIYPRSFMDSNNDGIGDIRGIISKLDYLKELGITVIWLSPIFKSPNTDNGYDISDYCSIMEEFGSIEDFKALLNGAHSIGIKLILDLVVNHTSDKHPWFLEAKKSKDNPYHDYYLWSDKANNWKSFFSGSAWEYVPELNLYYLHMFGKNQPDLNWKNPKVRQEIHNIARYWLDLGVDGFRIDTANMYSKVEGFPDCEGEGLILPVPFFINGPEIHNYHKEFYNECFSKYDCFTVGETPFTDPEEALLFVGVDRQEMNMCIHFEHIGINSYKDRQEFEPVDMHKVKEILIKWQEKLSNDGWNCLYLSNHDQPRQVSRYGNDSKYHKESAKMLGAMLHTLKGTPFIYQGEEIGMTNVGFCSISEINDIESLNNIPEFGEEKVLAFANEMGRDNARTPFHWNSGENAGFSNAKPWIRCADNYKLINAYEQKNDPDSILNFYKRLISLRKLKKALVYGDFHVHETPYDDLFCYTRELEGQSIFVLLNMSDKSYDYKVPNGKLLLSNYNHDSNIIKPYEARIIEKAL